MNSLSFLTFNLRFLFINCARILSDMNIIQENDDNVKLQSLKLIRLQIF